MNISMSAPWESPPIADYALLGDTRTAALVSSAGSIDWMCVPNFDREPVFGRLVGGPRSGSFSITVADLVELRRSYADSTAVLDTDLVSTGGVGRLTEAMVVDVSGRLLPQLILVRRVRCTSGSLRLTVVFDPKLGWRQTSPRAARRARALVCDWGSLAIALQSWPDLGLVPGQPAEIDVPAGTSLTLVMTLADRSPVTLVAEKDARELVEDTTRWWNSWSEKITYEGPFREAVLRSLITLQLLTFGPSGAPVAAATTSLPEVLGGSRNWDYRYSWPRDASIGLAAFLALGQQDLAHSYLHWLLHASRLKRPRLQVLYTVFGKPSPREREIEGVDGYRGSLPVREGNAAFTQHQLDVYGWVLDAAWLLTRAGTKLHPEFWRALAGFADTTARCWRDPDAGIWEIRQEQSHFVHSKLMAWLCLDRALRIAADRRTQQRRVRLWQRERDLLAATIKDRGFDPARSTYVRAFDSSDLDAALLLLPILEFEDDPARVHGTISAIREELGVGDGLIFRYRSESDGLKGSEGAFLPCSFWLVQALARIGRRDEALETFEGLLRLANDVGLYSEEIDPESKQLLGNFPQAFTHAALIQAALSLRDQG
ncbi:MAG TPA: glycoside hydrolase family 15 protein [Actinomycetota bacterium]|nr:glycoside hydrolase family 15 protein [Actinomycetota bacterium]